jgi:HK97 family phage prohead protease
MKRRIERRFVPISEFEFRAGGASEDGADKPPELVGYASVFGQETEISDWFGGWREMVAPGAFRKTIKESDIRALWNHDPNIVLGRNKAGTLQLKEDEHGLHTVIQPPDNEWGRPVLDAVKRGDVTGMSIAFQVVKEQIERPAKESQELPKRTIKEAKLFDVSPVTFPAFEQTEIDARSGLRSLPDDPETDVLLRAAALARWAQRGMVLTAEEMRTISEAVGIYKMLPGEPEPESGEDESLWTLRNHSPEAQGDEPAAHPSAAEADASSAQDAYSHSEAARARRLQLLRLGMEATR